MTFTFTEAAAAALLHAEAVCRHLLPFGARRGADWCAGDITGRAGDSLKVNLNSGKWADFGGDAKGGDLVSLWAAVKGVNQGVAANQLGAFVGLAGAFGDVSERASVEEWLPLPSAPKDAPAPWLLWQGVEPVNVWTWRNAAGDTVGHTARYEFDGDKKDVLPWAWCRSSQTGKECWRFKAFATPRPLLNVLEFVERTAAPVLVVEGEGKVDAARVLLPDFVATCWQGGCKKVKDSDWSTCAGRRVYIWPDNDEPGRGAAQDVCHHLEGVAAEIWLVTPPPDKPDTWDIKDAFNVDKWTPDQTLTFLRANSTKYEPEQTLDAKPEPETVKPPPAPPVEVAPFYPVGHDAGHFFYFSRKSGQIVELKAAAHCQLPLLQLAPLEYWQLEFPGSQGVNWNAAANALVQASYKCGVFNPDLIRGRGAWLDAGRIVFNAGDRILCDGVEYKLGCLDSEFIYEACKKTPADFGELNAMQCAAFVELCDSLPWRAPIYGRLLAGWCFIAPICGVLRWRPHVWINGPTGSGKSWIMSRIVSPIVGPSAVTPQSSTSEPGLRQAIGSDAVPVIFDEIEQENKHDSQRVQTVLELARQASSEGDGVIMKGSASGQAVTYRVRSAFCFASIGVSATRQPDAARVTSLELFKRDGANGAKDFERVKALHAASSGGRDFPKAFRARALRLAKAVTESAEVFSGVAGEALGEARHGDQLGALLAGAWHVTNDSPATIEQARSVLAELDLSTLNSTRMEVDEDSALSIILGARERFEGTGQANWTVTLSELIVMAQGDAAEAPFAKDTLARCGLRFYGAGVAVSNNHPFLKRAFSETPWAEKWSGMLARIKGAKHIGEPLRFSGHKSRAVVVPLEALR